MPLVATKDAFVQHLMLTEKNFPATARAAVKHFVDGYITFISASTTSPIPVPIQVGALQTPAAREAFEASLLLAYLAKSPEAFCTQAEKAIQAFYLACGGAPALFIGSTNFVFATPLKTFWLPTLSNPTNNSLGARRKLVDGIISWKLVSLINFPVPPGGIGPQVWV